MNDQVTPVPLTADNVPQDLPPLVRKALAYASGLEIGTLIIRLPDGRRFLAGGKAPGPDAELIVHDFAFAQRLIREGDIGIGEAYLAKEWDTPDLTAFLQIFAANHPMIERMGTATLNLGHAATSMRIMTSVIGSIRLGLTGR